MKEKQISFRVIDFVEKEKTDPVIPLDNTNARLPAMLGISKRSLSRFKKEIVDQRQKKQEEQELVHSQY